MGRKKLIQAALDKTSLGTCCVTNPFKALNTQGSDKRLSTWGQQSSPKNKTTTPLISVMQDPALYLQSGSDLVKTGEWAGVCATFACATASVIAKSKAATTIELFSFGQSFNGHVYLIVDRDPNSDPAQPGTWGSCLAVDVWYAIQQGHPDDAVFKPNSPYFTWLANQPKIKLGLRVV